MGVICDFHTFIERYHHIEWLFTFFHTLHTIEITQSYENNKEPIISHSGGLLAGHITNTVDIKNLSLCALTRTRCTWTWIVTTNS